MAAAMRGAAVENKALICPMLDARRQEVFTALYSPDMQEILAPRALILDKTSFEEELSRGKVIFAGSGSEKWREMTPSPHAIFSGEPNIDEDFARLSARDFEVKKWADPIYAEPIYLKEFHTHAKN
jgi:tRNA threonylcarbamoyladenosine biosynthesis protein TsaB